MATTSDLTVPKMVELLTLDAGAAITVSGATTIAHANAQHESSECNER